MCHSNRPCPTPLPGNIRDITHTVGPTPGHIIDFFIEKSDVPSVAREGGWDRANLNGTYRNISKKKF